MSSLASFLGLIPELIMFIVVLMYFSRARTRDAILLFAGSLIHVITRIYFAVVPLLALGADDSSFFSMPNIYLLGSVIGFIGSVIFCIGFVILIRRVMPTLTKA